MSKLRFVIRQIENENPGLSLVETIRKIASELEVTTEEFKGMLDEEAGIYPRRADDRRHHSIPETAAYQRAG